MCAAQAGAASWCIEGASLNSPVAAEHPTADLDVVGLKGARGPPVTLGATVESVSGTKLVVTGRCSATLASQTVEFYDRVAVSGTGTTGSPVATSQAFHCLLSTLSCAASCEPSGEKVGLVS